MPHKSRRKFIQQLGEGGLAASLAAAAGPKTSASPTDSVFPGGEAIPLGGNWNFKLDPQDAGLADGWHREDVRLSDWSDVRVPHTWQVEAHTADHQGVACYRRTFEAPAWWAEKMVRLEFEAVSHSATV